MDVHDDSGNASRGNNGESTTTLIGVEAFEAAEVGDVVQFRLKEMTVSDKHEFDGKMYIELEGPRGGDHGEIEYDGDCISRAGPDETMRHTDLKIEVEDEIDIITDGGEPVTVSIIVEHIRGKNLVGFEGIEFLDLEDIVEVGEIADEVREAIDVDSESGEVAEVVAHPSGEYDIEFHVPVLMTDGGIVEDESPSEYENEPQPVVKESAEVQNAIHDLMCEELSAIGASGSWRKGGHVNINGVSVDVPEDAFLTSPKHTSTLGWIVTLDAVDYDALVCYREHDTSGGRLYKVEVKKIDPDTGDTDTWFAARERSENEPRVMTDGGQVVEDECLESKLDADFEAFETELRDVNAVLYEEDEVVVLVDKSLREIGEIAEVLGEEYEDVREVMRSRVDDMRRTLERETRHLPTLRADCDLLVFRTGDGG